MKILAYHNLIEGKDFIDSSFYVDNHIKAIKDPEGGLNSNIPTSIPSPFAVIDLCATAFNQLAQSPTLKGNVAYERIVSRTLDVAMIFFNYGSLKDKVDIVVWNKENELKALSADDASAQHKNLGTTLHAYMEEDSHAYNFNDLNDFFFLRFNYNIIGGTSPKTLFFTSMNPLEKDVNNRINLGDDHILFSDKYTPLYGRSDEFQYFVYLLTLNVKKFANKCPELNSYLKENLKILKKTNSKLYTRISDFSKGNDAKERIVKAYNQYNSIETDRGGKHVNILGTNIGSRPPKKDDKSDFKIKSSKLTGKPHMALSPGFSGQSLFGESMVYFGRKFSEEIGELIPYSSNVPIEERELPGLTGVKYPHVLPGDFFEDVLFKSGPVKINKRDFFDSNLNQDKFGIYHCPLKKTIFSYLDIADIISGTTSSGEKIFSLEQKNEYVKAILYIPVQSQHIKFEKIYTDKTTSEKQSRNRGTIDELDLNINLFPKIKPKLVDKSSTVEYRTHFTLQKDESEITILKYNKNNELIKTDQSFKKEDKNYEYRTLIAQQPFEYLELKFKGHNILFLPIWEEKDSPSENFSFAIDFGTTNTHIEYRKGDSLPQPFSLTSEAVGTLCRDDDDYRKQGYREFLPTFINDQSNFSFPQRTILASTKSLDFQTDVYSIADGRIPFYYGSEELTPTSEYHSNLKWANYVNEDSDTRKVEMFLEQLILLMKAKVIAELGILEKTQFVWFFPSSMFEGRVNKLSGTWEKLIKRHFNVPNHHIKSYNESIAPFAYYSKTQRVDAIAAPAVTIDVGGGTSDIVVFKNDEPVKLSSFRYAANSIFGDGYNSNYKQNGYVRAYKDKVATLLEKNGLKDLLKALNSILGKSANDHNDSENSVSNDRASADIIAFFMSLKNKKQVKELHTPLNFQEMLADDTKLLLPILLFHYSVIYHLASFMKRFNLAIPREIIFSGNGGNLIRLLDRSSDFKTLSEYTKRIFEDVYGEEAERTVSLRLNDDPKAVTAKGGLYADGRFNIQLDEINRVITGSKLEPEELPKYNELRDYENEIFQQVTDEVYNALEGFIKLNDDFSYHSKFSISDDALGTAREYLLDKSEISRWLKKGMDMRLTEMEHGNNSKIEETLFFYPLTGMLNVLADKVVE